MFRQTSAETLVIKDYSNFRSYSSAAISMVVVCHIQAGVPAIVKWEEGHAVMVDLHAVPLRCLPAAYTVFYNFKKIHCTSISAQKTAACPIWGKPPSVSFLMMF